MFSNVTQTVLSMHMQITPTINICYISKYNVTFMEWKILEITWLSALFNKHN
jgi:hypothetical protein